MLERLAQSQEQTVWYSLWDKVWNQANLDQAIFKVILNRGGAGVDGYTTEQLKVQWQQQGEHLQEELRGGTYQPKPARRAWIPKLGSTELRPLVKQKIADGKVLRLLEQYLQAGVMDSHKGWQATEQGTPQGAVISPLLANLYLNPLDHQMARQGWEMVRYADDFVVCARTELEAQSALAEIAAWVQGAGLRLHPTKTRIINAAVTGGFDFLGYHFEQYASDGGKKWPREKSRFKLRENLRQKLSRSRPGSIPQIATEINRTLQGWFKYFRWSQPTALRDMDQWTRERIRHILRRRNKRHGMVRGRERTEYPIHWFAEQGLFSLTTAQARWLQSLAGTH